MLFFVIFFNYYYYHYYLSLNLLPKRKTTEEPPFFNLPVHHKKNQRRINIESPWLKEPVIPSQIQRERERCGDKRGKKSGGRGRRGWRWGGDGGRLSIHSVFLAEAGRYRYSLQGDGRPKKRKKKKKREFRLASSGVQYKEES